MSSSSYNHHRSRSGLESSGRVLSSDNLFEDVGESTEELDEEAAEAAEEAVEEAEEEEEEEEEEEDLMEEDHDHDHDDVSSTTTTIAAEDCSQNYCENQVSVDFLLKYKVNVPEGMTLETCDETCTISFESIYEGEAWVSVGFSTDGRMIGSDAVIGIPGEVPQKYIMTSETNDGVQPMPEDQQTLTDASVESNNGQTIMKFTKLLKESGEIDINAGDNIFLWANGYSNTLGLHKSFSSVNVNLVSGSVEARKSPNMSAWLAHGILAFIAWGVLVPFAVQFSMFRSLLPKGKESLWFKVHRAFNGMAFALFVVLFAMAVAYTAKEGGEHFDEAHQIMGLAMFILAFLQVIGGVFRPHLPPSKSDEKKTKVRTGWEIGHRMVGMTLLACGFWQMYSGIEWYSYKYGVNDNGILIAYWVWIGLMTVLFMAGIMYTTMRIRNASQASTTDAKPEPDTGSNTLRASVTDAGDT